MNTKTVFISLFISIFLSACTSTETINQPVEPISSEKVCCDDFSQFRWIPLSTTEDIDFLLDSDSPIGHFSDGNSYFNAFKLSDRSQKVQLSLSSLMINSSVVAPKLITLNKEFEIVSSSDLEQFTVKASSAFSRTQFQLNVELDATKTPYFVIYSSDSYLGQSIKVKHPARVRAEEFGEVMPIVTDPTYTYERFGRLTLALKTLSLQANKESEKSFQVATKPVQPETQIFYKTAITKAINNSDIQKALSLLEEANGLGIKDAESAFIKALKLR